jgi:uncharacterized damage-inducible protein DinB
MTHAQILLSEFNYEAASTRKLLALVPMDKKEFKPHEKSMTLGGLSTHVAEIAGWWKECLIHDELDFAVGDFKPKVFETNNDLLNLFDDLVAKTNVILNETDDAEFANPWTMRNGEMIYFTMPKAQVVRTWCLNHWYHHRAQLGVYLRLLDIPLPGIYGPSADDNG